MKQLPKLITGLIFIGLLGCRNSSPENSEVEDTVGDSTNINAQKIVDIYSEEDTETDDNMLADSVEGWFIKPDSASGVKGSIQHYRNKNHFLKVFSSANGKHFYFNARHGYFVSLPKDMGYLQSGEIGFGNHSNEFYNNDTTVVISSYAFFYDVLLQDYPDYEDTIRNHEKKYMEILGKPQYIKTTPKEMITKGKIDHSNPENPPADYYISKLVLKKDIEDRECHMNIIVYYEKQHKSREKEFMDIINKFPEKPF